MIPRYRPEALDAAIARSCIEQGELIREALIEEGYDPNSNEPMPAHIADRIAERLGTGEFSVPLRFEASDIVKEGT